MSSTILASDVSRLLLGLDDAQVEAVLSPAPILSILAGAGSGKTRVLTRRIARRIADDSASAQHVIAVTFTNKAATEMRSRLRGLLGEEFFPPRPRAFMPRPSEGPSVQTLHGLGYAILARSWSTHGAARPHLTDRRSAMIADALAAIDETTLTVGGLEAEVGWTKARAISAANYVAAADRHHRAVEAGGRLVDPHTVARAFDAYETLKGRRNVIDLDDLIVSAVRALEADTQFLAAQRFWYRHLFVDEYQDVNPAQFRLLRLLAGDEPDLCVVGDPNQAIYGWNGADPGLLVDFRRYFPTAGVVRLETNYRSRRPIVAAASTVLNLTVPTVSEGAESGAVPALWHFPDPQAEAEGIARLVQRLIPRYGASGIAVLAPTSSQLDPVAVALEKRMVLFERAGWSLLRAPEVRAVLERLRKLVSVRNGRPLLQSSYDIDDLCDRSARGLPLDDPQGWDGFDDDGNPVIRGLADNDPRYILNKASLDAFVELLEEFAKAIPEGDIDNFEAWATAVLARREAGERGRSVVLSSIHRAKGLEWPVVILMGCTDRALPNWRTRTPEAIQESRRVAYVALTRASEEAYCTWPRTILTRSGRTEATRPSPFLAELPQMDGSAGMMPPESSSVAYDPDAARRGLKACRSLVPKRT